MTKPTEPTGTYEFDGFRMDVARRLLLQPDNAPVALTPKAFDTLLHLVENCGSIVTKEELLKAVWQNTAVEENNLNQNISALRKALGGGRNQNRFIVTYPGRGYSFVAAVTSAPAPRPAVERSTLKTLAVLPFRPIASDRSDAALELGMADTLIARLSTLRQLVVRPTSSIRNFTRPDEDSVEVGRRLGVETLLEGSLQMHGPKVRVTARLLRMADGSALWAGTFDEPFTDIFALQDSIAEKVVSALHLHLTSAELSRVKRHQTESAEAYRLYLKGRYYWWKTSPEEFRKSREYFHRAVEIDPEYGLGYCGLNSFYGFSSAFGLLPPEDGWTKAEWSARRALQIDDQLAEAHLGMAAFQMVHGDCAGAEASTLRSIELNPQFDEIHYFYSFLLMATRRFDLAVAEARKALACDPFSLRINLQLANILLCARRFDDAVEQCHQSIDLHPNDASVHEFLGSVLNVAGRPAEALQEFLRAAMLSGDTEMVSILRSAGNTPATSVQPEIAKLKLRRLEAKLRSGEYVPSVFFMEAYSQLGDETKAWMFLEKAAQERNVYSLLIFLDPRYEQLTRNPRFSESRKRIEKVRRAAV